MLCVCAYTELKFLYKQVFTYYNSNYSSRLVNKNQSIENVRTRPARKVSIQRRVFADFFLLHIHWDLEISIVPTWQEEVFGGAFFVFRAWQTKEKFSSLKSLSEKKNGVFWRIKPCKENFITKRRSSATKGPSFEHLPHH